MSVSARIASAAIAASLSLACGTDPSPPTNASYTLTFPSTAAAVSTDSVQVLVFEVPDGGTTTLCPSLIATRRSKQPLPPRVVESRPTSPCNLAAGRQQISLAYGARAILAVGQRGGEDYLIGCALESIGDGDVPVDVVLTLISSSVAVPPTTCRELSEKCQGKCT